MLFSRFELATAKANGQRDAGRTASQLVLRIMLLLVQDSTTKRTKESLMLLVNLHLFVLGLLCQNKVAAICRVALLYFLVYFHALLGLISKLSFSY